MIATEKSLNTYTVNKTDVSSFKGLRKLEVETLHSVSDSRHLVQLVVGSRPGKHFMQLVAGSRPF